MKKVIMWLGMTTCGLSGGYAQTVMELEIHFAFDSDEISAKEQKRIDSALAVLSDKQLAYDVITFGHTDLKGTAGYNADLSKRRAKNVAKYVGKQIKTRKVITEGYAFNQPMLQITTNEADALNRRVSLMVNIPPPKIMNIGEVTLSTKKISIDAQQGGSFEYESGSKITIPPNALVDANGNSITGKVDIEYVEYRDPIDFILGGITMHHRENGQDFIFNSSGMFTISAKQKNENVYVRTGDSISVDFVSVQPNDGVNFYAFDTTSQRWSTVAQLTAPASNRDNTRVRCFTDNCSAMKKVITDGVAYAENNIPLFASMIARHKIDTAALYASAKREQATKIRKDYWGQKCDSMVAEVEIREVFYVFNNLTENTLKTKTRLKLVSKSD
ncbi:MAG: OmpA family protein, partial [Flavobacteriales bacterium]